MKSDLSALELSLFAIGLLFIFSWLPIAPDLYEAEQAQKRAMEVEKNSSKIESRFAYKAQQKEWMDRQKEWMDRQQGYFSTATTGDTIVVEMTPAFMVIEGSRE